MSKSRIATKYAAALTGAASLMAVFAGCSSGSGSSKGSTTTSITASPATSAPAGSSTTTAGSSGSLSDISSKLQASAGSAYAVTYAHTSSDNSTESVQFAQKPPSSFSFVDTKSDGTKSELISTASAAYSCSNDGSSWSCTSLPAAQFSGLANAFQIYKGTFWVSALQTAAAASVGVSVTPSTMNTAGVDLSCVTYSGGPVGKGGEVCVTSDGVLGFARNNDTGDTLKLTAYSTSPADSLFAVPAGATVVTIP